MQTLQRFFFLVALSAFIGCGDSDSSDKTDDAGTEQKVELPAEGSSYSVDINSGKWVTPDKIDKIIEILAGDYPFYVGAHKTHDSTLDLILAVEDNGKQQACNRTVVMQGVAADADGKFSYGPADFTIANGLKTSGLTLTGTLSKDQSEITGIELQGTIMLDTIPAEMLEIPEGSTACDLLKTVEVDCTECPDGKGGQCLFAHVTDLKATLVKELKLEEITQSDCHADCDKSKDNKDCKL